MNGKRARLMAALLFAGVCSGSGTIWADTKKKEKPIISKADQKAIDAACKLIQAPIVKKEMLRQQEMKRVKTATRGKAIKLIKISAKEEFILRGINSPGGPVGDFFPTWPPKGQGPMPSLLRPTNVK